jgi:hypothetical protein
VLRAVTCSVLLVTSASYDIKCKVIDNAVSLDKNCGFTHWRSRIVNKDKGNAFFIEAVEVSDSSCCCCCMQANILIVSVSAVSVAMAQQPSHAR